MNNMQKKLFCIIIASLFHCLTAFSQEIYIIKRGETLENIAKNRGVSAYEIQELNPLVDLYCTGMEIVLPERKVEVERHSYSSSSSSYSSGSSNVGKKRKNGFLNFLGNVLLGVGEAMFSGSYHSYIPTPPMPVAPMPIAPMPRPNYNTYSPSTSATLSAADAAILNSSIISANSLNNSIAMSQNLLNNQMNLMRQAQEKGFIFAPSTTYDPISPTTVESIVTSQDKIKKDPTPANGKTCLKLSATDNAHCNGMRVCSRCNGEKAYWDNSFGINHYVDPCVTCGGTGKCPGCNGTGVQ